MKIHVNAVSHSGNIREKNEDRIYVSKCETETDPSEYKIDRLFADTGNYSFAVFDGMGGLAFGDKAAVIARQCLIDADNSMDRIDIKKCISDMNNAVVSLKRSERQRTGSTLVWLNIYDDEFILANIGDSRGYLYRNGSLKQQSEDHTEAEMLRRINEDTSNSLQDKLIISEKSEHVLTQHLGIENSDFMIEPYICKGQLEDADVFLLCSDGLTDMLSDNVIETILSDNDYSLKDKCDRLLEIALKKGGRDNISIILVKIEL